MCCVCEIVSSLEIHPFFSGEESSVSSSDSVIRVSNCAQQPLGKGSLSSVCAEEIVEDCCIQGSDSSLREIVVVGFDLGASEVVRFVNETFDHICIVNAELSQILVLVSEGVVHQGADESIKLFLLVSLSVLLDDNRSSQVLKKFSSKGIKSLRGLFLHVMMVESLSLIVSSFILVEVIQDILDLIVPDRFNRLKVNLIFFSLAWILIISGCVFVSKIYHLSQLFFEDSILKYNLLNVFFSQVNFDFVVLGFNTNIGS